MGSPTSAPPPPSGGGKVFDRLKRAATGAPPPPPEEPAIVLDPLTGLPDRRNLNHWVDRAIRRSVPTSSKVVVAFVGIGLIRDVNDTYGADKGDELLVAIGERLKTIDLPGTEVLRYEGAEFAVIFEKLNHANANEEIAQFLVDLVGEPFDLHGDSISVAPSVGSAISADNYEDVDDMVRDAHRALAQARDDGVPWRVHDETKRGRYETRIDEARLHDALVGDEFLLHYQPIVDAANGELVGFEALLRWKAPGATNAGVMGPADFLPILEKSGLIVPVARWAIGEACRQLSVWNELVWLPKPLFVTCNLSPRQLADPSFSSGVDEAIRAVNLDPSLLCLDLTEHCLRANASDAWPALRELTNMGVKLSLDDFGTGVTSLHWLLELKLDYVRIERSFITALGANVYNREKGLPDPVAVILKHLTEMARDLDIEAIAEGVESAEEEQAVRSMGIPLAQGYRYGHPESAEVATTRIDPTAEKIHIWDPNDVMETPVVEETPSMFGRGDEAPAGTDGA